MLKSALKENKVLRLVLVFCMLSALSVCSSCRKKGKPEDAEQNVSAEDTRDKPIPEKVIQPGISGKLDLHILYPSLPHEWRASFFTWTVRS